VLIRHHTDWASACFWRVAAMAGWGNLHFKTSRNQAPRRANSGGRNGVERTMLAAPKLIADGGSCWDAAMRAKSLFLAAVSQPRPKIAITRSPPCIPIWVSWAVDNADFVMAPIFRA